MDSSLPLTRIAARNLARLMAYKDEYEVARLYSKPEFMEQLHQNFEGEPGKDYAIKLNLAPPLLTKHDSQGKPIKSEYGAWMFKLMPYLARLKGLRGSVLDVFGYGEERKQERALIKEYQAIIAQLAKSLTAENLSSAQAQLDSFSQIKGFGYIKTKALAKVKQQSTNSKLTSQVS